MGYLSPKKFFSGTMANKKIISRMPKVPESFETGVME
jgi:hypothetical protein